MEERLQKNKSIVSPHEFSVRRKEFLLWEGLCADPWSLEAVRQFFGHFLAIEGNISSCMPVSGSAGRGRGM